MSWLGKLVGNAATAVITKVTTMTVDAAIAQWEKEHPNEVASFNRNGIKPDVRVLTDAKYRDIRFDGCMEFEGKNYYTIGEYNDAVDDAYAPGGKYNACY